MARFANEITDTRGWVMVSLVHQGDPMSVERCWEDIGRWLNDPARPGQWQIHGGHAAFFFFISDPDVAFEFKMRWG